jgi:hypothetical protein
MLKFEEHLMHSTLVGLGYKCVNMKKSFIKLDTGDKRELMATLDLDIIVEDINIIFYSRKIRLKTITHQGPMP